MKNFRGGADTRTPGHPEYGLTPGIEMTTIEQPLQTNAILQLNKKIFDIFFDAISWHFLPQNWL